MMKRHFDVKSDGFYGITPWTLPWTRFERATPLTSPAPAASPRPWRPFWRRRILRTRCATPSPSAATATPSPPWPGRWPPPFTAFPGPSGIRPSPSSTGRYGTSMTGLFGDIEEAWLCGTPPCVTSSGKGSI